MTQVRVDAPFATVEDVAEALGVPASRRKKLTKLVNSWYSAPVKKEAATSPVQRQNTVARRTAGDGGSRKRYVVRKKRASSKRNKRAR